MTKKPMFSIVIPTRDRIKHMKFNLQILKMATFDDYEVIVSDNPTSEEKACKKVFERIGGGDERFHYVRPPHPMHVCDHFEYAFSFAKGKYQILLEDKEYLHPGCLEAVAKLCEMHSYPPLVSFEKEEYMAFPEGKGFPRGVRQPQEGFNIAEVPDGNIYTYDPAIDIEYLNSYCQFLIMNEGMVNARHGGMVWSTCFVRDDILEQMRKMFGRLFWTYGIDWGMKISAELMAAGTECLHMNIPFNIRCRTEFERGVYYTSNYNRLKEYIRNWPKYPGLKPLSLPFCEPVDTNTYVTLKEMNYIEELCKRKGKKIGTNINRGYALGRIYGQIQRNIFLGEWKVGEEKEKWEMIMEKALCQLTEDEKDICHNIIEEEMKNAKEIKANQERTVYNSKSITWKICDKWPIVYQYWLAIHGKCKIFKSPIHYVKSVKVDLNYNPKQHLKMVSGKNRNI